MSTWIDTSLSASLFYPFPAALATMDLGQEATLERNLSCTVLRRVLCENASDTPLVLYRTDRCIVSRRLSMIPRLRVSVLTLFLTLGLLVVGVYSTFSFTVSTTHAADQPPLPVTHEKVDFVQDI